MSPWAFCSCVLGVTQGSSSYGILATGGGIYGDLYTLMQDSGDRWKISSVSSALQSTLADPKFSVFAGREKLVFDTTRLGRSLFHINSQVFFTKYKGVVLRNGSPLRKPFDKLLMRIFESGLLNKITNVTPLILIIWYSNYVTGFNRMSITE